MKMSRFKLLSIILISIIFSSCKNNEIDGKWLYSLEYSGMVYTGMIYDFESEPMTRQSLLNDFFCDTIIKEDSLLFVDTIGIGKIVWKNEKCFVIDGLNDSLVFHRIPNMQTADSMNFVSEFLTSSPILYKDDFYEFKYYFDTTLNDRQFYSSAFKNMDNPNYGFEYSDWRLEIMNGSLILLNKDYLSLFHQNLLITNITKDSIIGLKIRFPESMHDSIVNAIEFNNKINFEYDKFSLVKGKSLSNESLDSIRYQITSRTWEVFRMDSSYISYGKIYPKQLARVFPKKLKGLKYRFLSNNDYEIFTADSLFSGTYDISIDGRYIILDGYMEYDNNIEINTLTDTSLIINHILKIHNSDRKYRTYNCKIELR